MSDEAMSVTNQPEEPPVAPAAPITPTAEPSLLLVGAIATVGIVALCGAALYFWPKIEETKRPVRPRRPVGEPTRVTRRKPRRSKARAKASTPDKKTKPKPHKTHKTHRRAVAKRRRRRMEASGLPVNADHDNAPEPEDTVDG